MGKNIRLSKGFDINLAGKAAPKIADVELAETFVVKPTDFHGLYMPKPVVTEGDTVKAGTPLFHAKNHEDIQFTSPVSGEVVEVKRGEKRKLLEIKILADRQVEHVNFKKYSLSEMASLPVAEIKEQMLKSGVWANLVHRPFGIVAEPTVVPKSIHISGFDTAPLAPDYSFLFRAQDQFFQQVKGAEVNKFTGKHPAGCVGVQIHHVDPINKGDVVWTISPLGVIQVGKLFLQGIYDASRLVAVTGSEVKNPQYYRTYTGASVKKFLSNNLKQENVRVISGNVLTGASIGKDGHLGFFDNQLTVIPEGDYHEFLGWITPSNKSKLSFHRAFGLLSFLTPSKEYVLDSNTHGEERAFVQTGVFEQVLPMDVLPTQLLKSILAEDIDEMEALGIYEVIEEDLALCEFVDVSKHNVQEILRDGIELVRNS